MSTSSRPLFFHWRSPIAWLLFIFAVGLTHVVTVLVMASDRTAPALMKLHRAHPINHMTLLQPVTPDNQPIKFMMANAVYAVCPFEISASALRISVNLAGTGWAVSMHTLDGNGFYFAPGRDSEPSTITLDVLPPGDALNALELAANPEQLKIAKVEAPEARGLILVRAPIRARSYLGQVVKQLEASQCAPIGRGPTQNENGSQ